MDKWHVAIEIDGKYVEPSGHEVLQNTISYNFDKEMLRMDAVFEHIDDRIILDASLTNTGSTPVSIGKIYPFVSQDIPGWKAEDDVVVLASLGGQFPQAVLKVSSPEALRVGKTKLQFYNRTNKQALQVGFLGFRKIDNAVSYEYNDKQGIHTLKAYCNLAGWKIEPGNRINLETFSMVLGKNPHNQLIEWAGLVVKKYSPKFISKPVIGWFGLSWVDLFSGISKEKCLDGTMGNLDAINHRLKGFGVNYLWTWGNLSKENLLKWNSDRLPPSPLKFRAAVKSKGFKLGIWCAPFRINADRADELSDYLLKRKDGSLLETRSGCYALDTTHPKTHTYLKQVFETFREWE